MLRFARDHKDWTVENWIKGSSSPISPIFSFSPPSPGLMVTQRAGETYRYKLQCLAPTVKSVMTWGVGMG